jgi:UDP-glucose 4-epimerase
MSKHVLVTGGAGFIGSHLVDAYVERGWRVSIIDNLSSGKRSNLNPAASFHEADIRDAATADLVRELRPDVMSHHAAQMDVRVSVADPVMDAGVNVVGSVRLFEAAHQAGTRRIVFASSGGALYGEPVAGLQDEDHPASPLSPYGCAKLSVEHYLHFYRAVYGIETVALRYANVYGPRQNAHGEAGVVAIFAGKLLAGEEVTINGDGLQTRDFVYVSDVVAANMAASEGIESGAYNVGTGVETSIVDLYRMMSSIACVARPALHAPAKLGEQLRSVLDRARLRKAAGLRPPVTFREGLERTIEWFRQGR